MNQTLFVEGFPSGATVGYAKAQLRDVLKLEFNKSVELQVIFSSPIRGSVFTTYMMMYRGIF